MIVAPQLRGDPEVLWPDHLIVYASLHFFPTFQQSVWLLFPILSLGLLTLGMPLDIVRIHFAAVQPNDDNYCPCLILLTGVSEYTNIRSVYQREIILHWYCIYLLLVFHQFFFSMTLWNSLLIIILCCWGWFLLLTNFVVNLSLCFSVFILSLCSEE